MNIANNNSLTAVNYDFAGDGGITRNGNSPSLKLAGGTMEKSAGTNVFTIDAGIPLASTNGAFVVDSGTLALPGNGSYYTNATFDISSNASAVLAPSGHTVTLAGEIDGSGSGTVLVQSSTINPDPAGVNLDLPGSMLEWNSVTLTANGPILNSGGVTLVGGGDIVMQRNATFNNAGVTRQTGTGRINEQLNARILEKPGHRHL